MATLLENIANLENAKASIKTAIEAKGVVVPSDAKIDTYYTKVDEITGGSAGGNLDLTGTGWETEEFFPVSVARLGTLKEDLDYTRQKYSEWVPNGTSLNTKYQFDTNLVYAPKIDTSAVTDMAACFFKCSNLTSIPQLDTSAVTDMTKCFNFCSNLTTIPQLDTSAVTVLRYCFHRCSSLTSLGGFWNLKASLDLSTSPKLTQQSLMNVISNLDNANPSFAEGKPILTLGPTNLAKLTEEEIAVGTAKGWQIVA